MPGQPANTNALKHGMRSWAMTGKLPPGTKYLRGQLRKLRAELERETLPKSDQSSRVSIFNAALISSAVRHEGRAKLCERWLSSEGDKLSLPDRLSLLKEIGTATDSRDKALRLLLKPDESPAAPWVFVGNADDASENLKDK